MTHFNLQSNPAMQLNEIFKKQKIKHPRLPANFE